VIALSVASTLAAGLASDFAGLRRVLVTRVTWAVLAGNLVVVPMIAWLVMPSIVSGPAVIGLLLIAAAPGGGIGPLLALLGRGDAALAGALFLVLSIAGTVIALALTLVLDARIADMLRAAMFVAASALAPLVIGLVIGRYAPRLAGLALPWTSRLGALLLVATVVWFSIKHGRQLSAPMLGAAGMLALASALVGWLATRFVGITKNRAVTIAVVEISLVRNVALTLVVVTGLGGATDAMMSVLTYALVMLVGGGGLAMLARRSVDVARDSQGLVCAIGNAKG
jgi:BASS family bile acid:Na+ symporter